MLEQVDVAERALDADHRPARLRSARWETAAMALDDAELDQARIQAAEYRVEITTTRPKVALADKVLAGQRKTHASRKTFGAADRRATWQTFGSGSTPTIRAAGCATNGSRRRDTQCRRNRRGTPAAPVSPPLPPLNCGAIVPSLRDPK